MMGRVEGGMVIGPFDDAFIIMGRLQVPVALATGQYEKLTDEELDEHAADIEAERTRRSTDGT